MAAKRCVCKFTKSTKVIFQLEAHGIVWMVSSKLASVFHSESEFFHLKWKICIRELQLYSTRKFKLSYIWEGHYRSSCPFQLVYRSEAWGSDYGNYYPKPHVKVLVKVGLESSIWGFRTRFSSILYGFLKGWISWVSINHPNLYAKNFPCEYLYIFFKRKENLNVMSRNGWRLFKS